MFVEAPGGDAQAFSDRAKVYNLLVVPGGGFGCPSFFRLSTCVSSEMVERSLPVFEKLAKLYFDNGFHRCTQYFLDAHS